MPPGPATLHSRGKGTRYTWSALAASRQRNLNGLGAEYRFSGESWSSPMAGGRNPTIGEAFSELGKSSLLMKWVFRLLAALGAARGRPA
jgi:hypothetical protein